MFPGAKPQDCAKLRAPLAKLSTMSLGTGKPFDLRCPLQRDISPLLILNAIGFPTLLRRTLTLDFPRNTTEGGELPLTPDNSFQAEGRDFVGVAGDVEGT